MEIPADVIIKHLKNTIAEQAQQIAVQAAYIEALTTPSTPTPITE